MQKTQNWIRKIAKSVNKIPVKNLIIFTSGLLMFLAGIFIVWVSLLKLPDFESFSERKIQSSTKIYDRTGKILLYDVHQDVKRTMIPYEAMGVNIKNATVAIEDSEFYKHKGIRISSIIRATIWAKLTGKRIQGGSTITQQLIKNTLLTPEVTIKRKIKEWILAYKLEKVMSKDQILTLYLNEAPYGGNIYGIKEASKAFFGKDPMDLTLAEAAYMAAIPNGPTYYSPYGKNKAKLDNRKNLVLKRMLDLKFIEQKDYEKAIYENVVFLPYQPMHIEAPHFVFFIKDYLENKYGPEKLDLGGLNVTTTIDYNLQKKVEEIVLRKAKENEKNWNGKNAAAVVLDPKTGQILAMVGSRDYFDKNIDGNFNVATAERQPGSSFKPIVYALAFKKGYTKDTVLFDVNTEFNSSCDPTGSPKVGHKSAKCYNPENYDNSFRGPMTLKDALAQSINIIAVKLLYLVGVNDSIKLAHDLGITTLNDPTRYGLSLVIGGGETTLLDMTSAYGVFANNGIKEPYTGVLSIEDSLNNIIEKYQNKSYKILEPNTTRILSEILSDNQARTPTFGSNSVLSIPNHEVAVKTGTTNDNKDAWTIGYTPSVSVGVWVGNNDNIPMKKGGVSLAGPIWNEIMIEVLKNLPNELFDKPDPIDQSLPPILRGFWQGGETFITDVVSGGLINKNTPDNTKKEQSVTNVHTILYWLDKNNPTTKSSGNTNDPQFTNWEYGVQKWWNNNKQSYKQISIDDKPAVYDSMHTENSKPFIVLKNVLEEVYKNDQVVDLDISVTSKHGLKKVDVFVNNVFVTTMKNIPFRVYFTPKDVKASLGNNTIRIIAQDIWGNVGEFYSSFRVN